ncbi:MAG TPA: glycosyltransferase [Verrucomicrobiae bacterium]|nr:glycosyltransferase [Verrucomicrobiae bacterium]
MDISVIICTYNRAASLRQTLDAIGRQEIPTDLAWELIVVDNNSTDTTPAVAREFQQKLPLRYVLETRQGLSRARNRGIAESTAPLLVFTDDDITPDPQWLGAYLEAARLHPDAGFFGGKILPEWPAPPPSWLVKHSPTLLKGVTGHFDLGTSDSIRKAHFFGANMAFRRQVFDEGRRFRDDLGMSGKEHILGEELEFMRALTARGLIGVYVPTAVVHHRIAPEQMTESYVRDWFRGQGVTKARTSQGPRAVLVFGAPLLAWIKLGWYGMVYGLTRWTLPSSVWLRAATKRATCLGIIQEFRRRGTV